MSRFYHSKVSLNEQEEGRRSSSTNNNPPREGEMRSFTVWSEKWTSVHYCLVGHPIFHISKVKPVQESALVPAALAPMPPWFMMEVLPIWFAAWFILITVEEGYSIWLTGWGTIQRKGPGSQLDILRTRILSGISTATLTSPPRPPHPEGLLCKEHCPLFHPRSQIMGKAKSSHPLIRQFWQLFSWCWGRRGWDGIFWWGF